MIEICPGASSDAFGFTGSTSFHTLFMRFYTPGLPKELAPDTEEHRSVIVLTGLRSTAASVIAWINEMDHLRAGAYGSSVLITKHLSVDYDH